MTLQAQTLENAHLRLEPLDLAHRDDLRAACNADQAIWTELYPYSWAGEHFDPTWARVTGEIAAGRSIVYAAVAGGQTIGITSFGLLEAAYGVVEIGGTYFAPDHRGGPVNPSAKRLMMDHAFGAGVRRIVYRVDALNLRSRAAVTKLGAHQDGILRRDRICWTGRIRDTVVFSILADEWPEVRAKLDVRLAL